MNNDPTISILITYHNEKHLLTECINSITNQSLKPNEVIVYDDASLSPAKDYIPKGFNCEIIRGDENKGPGFARNILLKAATSNYVHFQDSDDLFHPDWHLKVNRLIETINTDLVITEIASFSKAGKIDNYNKMLDLSKLKTDNDLIKFAIGVTLFTPSTTFRKSLGLEIGGYLTKEIISYSEDFDFHIRLASKVRNYKVINESLIIVRLRNDSFSKSSNDDIGWLCKIRSIKLLLKTLPKKYNQDLSEVAAEGGSALFCANRIKEAKIAFRLAYKLGKPKFIKKNILYKIIAKIAGPMLCEYIGIIYRFLLPAYIRRKLQSYSFKNYYK